MVFVISYVNGMCFILFVMVIFWFYLLVLLFIGCLVGVEYLVIIIFIVFEVVYFSEIMCVGI